MDERTRRKIHQLCRELAKHREHHIGPWEKPLDPNVVAEVAAFLGRIRLEWHIADRMRKGE